MNWNSLNVFKSSLKKREVVFTDILEEFWYPMVPDICDNLRKTTHHAIPAIFSFKSFPPQM